MSLAALTPVSPTRHWVWRPWRLGTPRPRETQPPRPACTQQVPRPGWRRLSRAFSAQAALADGDLVAARRAADEAVTTAAGWYSMWALITRARVAIAQDEPDQAERDAHDALACAAEFDAYLGVSERWNASPRWRQSRQSP